MIAVTPENINQVAEWVGLPTKFDSELSIESLRPQLTGYDSGAAEGMTSPGSGTSKSPIGEADKSVSNSENT
ncbi:hypothetical protein D3C86_2186270 [compost metagenome]